jgi:hypothetical protein
VRRIKSQTFTTNKYRTEASVWRALEGQLGSLNRTRWQARSSTRWASSATCTSLTSYRRSPTPHSRPTAAWGRVHIKPKWENTRLADISALDVKDWLDKDFKGGGAASKKRAKDVISRMLDLAMLWKLTPTIERNPMQL